MLAWRQFEITLRDTLIDLGEILGFDEEAKSGRWGSKHYGPSRDTLYIGEMNAFAVGYQYMSWLMLRLHAIAAR
jgi:hypothetical protein